MQKHKQATRTAAGPGTDYLQVLRAAKSRRSQPDRQYSRSSRPRSSLITASEAGMAQRLALLACCLLAVLPSRTSAQGIWGPNGDGSSPSPVVNTGSQATPSPGGEPSGPAVPSSPGGGGNSGVPAPPQGASIAATLALPGLGSGAWFGVTKDFTSEDLSVYLPRAGINPVAYNIYVDLPLDKNSTQLLNLALPQIAAQNAIALLTVEPTQGLANVTYNAIGTLGYYLKQFQQGGGKAMVSFGQEMNGNWYIWGQQPSEYVAAYQRVFNTLQSSTCGVDMVWAPNAAVGYPWRSAPGGYGAQPGSVDFGLLDTNNDGELDINDDPYLPYYPGDQYVAWVGTSTYSWGGTGSAPYTENILSGPNQFASSITGESTQINDLYGRFSADGVHDKPMVITETSAMWLPSITVGVSDLQIKQTWWTQVFNTRGDNQDAPDVSVHFPAIKMILWFDISKPEGAANGQIVDWRFSGDPTVAGAFVQYLSQYKTGWNHSYWGLNQDFQNAKLGNGCPAGNSTSTASDTTASFTTLVGRKLRSLLA